MKKQLYGLLMIVGLCTFEKAVYARWILAPPPSATREFGYLAPNEIHPLRSEKIIQAAPKGIYVGVGADRCFNLASISEKIDRIICLDLDPEIVEFNLMNIFWLQVAEDRADYERLRLHAPWNEIARRLRSNLHRLNPKIISAITEHNLKRIREAFDDWKFKALHDRKFPNSAPGSGFAKINYVLKDEYFLRLKQLADADRIEAHAADLGDLNIQQYLAARLGAQLSILDLSNAWAPNYLGRVKTLRLIDQLADRNPNAIFLYTAHITPDSDPFDFSYGGVTLQNRQLLSKHLYGSKIKFGLLDCEARMAL